MSEINAYCKICGTGYHVCKSCGNMKSFTPWRMVADNINHYSIYLILYQYFVLKKISKSEAKEQLLSLDLSEKDNFLDTIKKQINEILDNDNKIIKKNEDKIVEKDAVVAKTETVKNTEEVDTADEEKDDTQEDEVQVTKMRYVPKSKRKNNLFSSEQKDVE